MFVLRLLVALDLGAHWAEQCAELVLRDVAGLV